MPSSFEIAGVLLAVWAVVVSYLGLRSPDFPRTPRAEKIVAAITIVLVAGAVAAGITSASFEYEEKQKQKAAASR